MTEKATEEDDVEANKTEGRTLDQRTDAQVRLDIDHQQPGTDSECPTAGHSSGHFNRSAIATSLAKVARICLLYFLKQWFLVGIAVAIILAKSFPGVAAEGGPIAAQYTIHWGVTALIFLLTGLGLNTRALINQATHWKLHGVTNLFEFLIFPSLMYGIINAVRAGQGLQGNIDSWLLVGMLVLGTCPTTVASNVTMTRLAGGNTEGATVEVIIGNVFGVFVTPLLLEMFLSERTGWGFGQPRAEGGQGVTAIYKQMGKQLALTLVLPLIVGQLVQNAWPKQTHQIRTKFHFDKVGQALLLLQIWSAFSKAFNSKAFDRLTPAAIVFVVFVNLGVFILITVLTLAVARLPGLSRSKVAQKMLFSREDAVAMCFCTSAKGIVLGSPLVAIFYSGYERDIQGTIIIPVTLYQVMQVGCAQLLTSLLKKWVAEDKKQDGENDKSADTG